MAALCLQEEEMLLAYEVQGFQVLIYGTKCFGGNCRKLRFCRNTNLIRGITEVT